MQLSFFRLKENDIYHVCKFLSSEDIVALSKVNKKFYQIFNTPRTFYCPIYENVSDIALQRKNIWEVLNSHSTFHDFYLTKEFLFKSESNAKGCFKIKFSWIDILKIDFELQKSQGRVRPCLVVPPEKPKYRWRLPIKPQQIESYIKRDEQEFTNIYKEQNRSSALPVKPK